MDYTKKEIIIFDLDNTLAESKSAIDNEMSLLLANLLKQKKVAVISGGSYEQFSKQLLENLTISKKEMCSLYLFPTCATCFYQHTNNKWNSIYEETLTQKEKKEIITALMHALMHAKFVIPKKLYGELVEDRGTQITFSAFGQYAPLSLKTNWDTDGVKRKKIKKYLDIGSPKFEARLGGTTSIDITRRGIDKAYGIKQIEHHLNIPQNKMLFIGDALFEGGNDYPVKVLGTDCIEVCGPSETKKVIENILK